METDLFKSSHDDEIPMEIGLNDEQAIIAELHSCRVNLQPGLPTSNDSQFCGLPVETSCVNYSVSHHRHGHRFHDNAIIVGFPVHHSGH
jgi:hypothetical protein